MDQSTLDETFRAHSEQIKTINSRICPRKMAQQTHVRFTKFILSVVLDNVWMKISFRLITCIFAYNKR